MENLLFNSSFGIKITPPQIIQSISDFIKVDPNREYRITVGTDSEQRPAGKADFVTAIVVHRVGNGGRYFWRHIEKTNIRSLRDRMWREVLTSLELSKNLVPMLKEAGLDKFHFEIHIDIGEKGQTKSMIQELTSMIRANNFEPKTKPESYAASKVADRHVPLAGSKNRNQ